MKLLVDVNLSPSWVEWLQHAGFESVYWSTFGPNTAPDSFIRHFARERCYVILTLDLDFGIDLADTQQSFPSVVQIRSQFAHSDQMRQQVIFALREASEELERGALITVTSDRVRVRRLPIR